jgi:uncharacterized membrane protein required for colicin V production
MSGIGWPDLLIGIIVVLVAIKGYRRGFVGELSGAVALVLALITPWLYNGSADGFIANVTHAGSGGAHVIGMFLTGIITYAIVIAIARLLDRVARLPILGIGNAIFGAAVGTLKGAVFCWLVLYIALFFPLSPDIRASLHASPTVRSLTQVDPPIDKALLANVPWFARPFVNPFFWRHTP